MEIAKIGERIKERRKELNLTQKDLAEGMHISDRLVSKWETGESVPSLEYLQLLSEVLQISVQSLMSIEETPTAVHEQPVPTEPKPKSPSKIKTFWSKNRKPLLISVIGGASALVLLAAILLSVFVFVPLANKKKYLEAIDKGIDCYLELGYFNIRSTVEVDGDKDTSPDILQGYFDDNGKAAFYNSETDEIVKDGVRTYKHRSGQKDYELPASIKTVPDLLEMLLKTWDGWDDAFDLEAYVKYIRKTSYGYYMEFSDQYLLDDLKPSEAKNIKFTEKIKGKVVMDGKKTKTITVTVKFRNTKDNENFSIVSKIEFLQSKPVIEHVNYVETANSEHVSKARFLELINATSLGDTINDRTKKLLAEGSLQIENGYVFNLSDEKDVTFYDPETLQVTKTVTPALFGIQAATVYQDYIWYVFRQSDSSTQWELRRYNLNTKQNTTKCYVPSGQCHFNDKYFYCDTYTSYVGFVYDMEKQAKIVTSNYIEYVDKSGTIFCQKGYDNPLYLYGSETSLKGLWIYKEENGYVYTADNEGVYQYKEGVYQKTVPLPTYDLQIQGEYCFTKGSDTIYDLDGNVVATLRPVRLKTNSYYGYSDYYPKVLAIWGDIVLAGMSLSSSNPYWRSGSVGFYRIGKWDAPVAHVTMTVNQVANTPSGNNILSFLYDSTTASSPYYNDASAEFWIIKK